MKVVLGEDMEQYCGSWKPPIQRWRGGGAADFDSERKALIGSEQ